MFHLGFLQSIPIHPISSVVSSRFPSKYTNSSNQYSCFISVSFKVYQFIQLVQLFHLGFLQSIPIHPISPVSCFISVSFKVYHFIQSVQLFHLGFLQSIPIHPIYSVVSSRFPSKYTNSSYQSSCFISVSFKVYQFIQSIQLFHLGFLQSIPIHPISPVVSSRFPVKYTNSSNQFSCFISVSFKVYQFIQSSQLFHLGFLQSIPIHPISPVVSSRFPSK